MTKGLGFDVSDVKTVRWTVFTSGVTPSKECGAGGYAARHGRLCDGDRMPAGGRYPPFHARPIAEGNRIGRREKRVCAAPRCKLGEFESKLDLTQNPARAQGAGGVLWRREWDSNPRSLSGTPVFKTGSLNRSDISPYIIAEVKERTDAKDNRPSGRLPVKGETVKQITADIIAYPA